MEVVACSGGVNTVVPCHCGRVGMSPGRPLVTHAVWMVCGKGSGELEGVVMWWIG